MASLSDSLKGEYKSNDHVDLQSYVNNPSLATPIPSSSLSAAHAYFKKTPSLFLKLRPLGQLSHSPVRPISNLNDISSQDMHLFELTWSNITLTHDNNLNAITSSPATMTNYGKKKANDGLQTKDSSGLGKHM